MSIFSMPAPTPKISVTVAEEASSYFEYGDVISRQWLMEKFKIEEPAFGSRKDFEKTQLVFMDKFESFRQAMLSNHQMYLESVRGIGYRIVEPKHQASAAMTRLRTVMDKELGKTKSALSNINEKHLTMTEIRQKDEQVGKLAAISAFNKRKLA